MGFMDIQKARLGKYFKKLKAKGIYRDIRGIIRLMSANIYIHLYVAHRSNEKALERDRRIELNVLASRTKLP